MHLLVTRPQPDASELIEGLQQAGHVVSYFPLLEINFQSQVKLPETVPQAVLITSANGARALKDHKQMPDLADVRAVTVGPASARAARQAGFNNIAQTKRGDVIGVIDYVREHLSPKDGPLLYASGAKTSGDLVGELQGSGFDINRVVLYQAEPAANLPQEICQFVNQGKLDGVLLFSPRTAKIWISLTKDCVSSGELAKVTYYCLSENVARIIDQGLGKFCDTISSDTNSCDAANCDIIICKKPDMSGMLQAVGAVS